LLAGATIPMAAQAISALVQLGEASPAQQLGLSPSRASAAGLTVTAGPTPVFWVYCIFVGALIACCAWLLLAPAHGPARPAPAWPAPPPGRAPSATNPAVGDRTPAMAGAPTTASATAASSAPTVAAPVTSQSPAAPSAPPGQEGRPDAPPAGTSAAGDPFAKPGDSPADPSGTQETRTSDGYSTGPARPADPAS
jgi:hypothetical protein